LVVLLGWQFAVAEFVGGTFMIVMLALVGGYVFTTRVVAAARRRLDDDPGVPKVERMPWKQKLTSREAWTDAAGYTMGDITMLRRELVIGYVVAGFLTMLVPIQWWNDVFMRGHGFWTTLENVIVGPFIAFISFVCSIGNVPMAAALWHGGISFGGVISFIFADLIALPLVLIYRKYYGGRLTLRLFATFWLVMSTAGLAVQGIFALFGALPTERPEAVVPDRFQWNYTTFLNIASLLVLGTLYWLYRHRDRFGSGRYATDPTCGMQVEKAHALTSVTPDGSQYWFCSEGCMRRSTEMQGIGQPGSG